jgi:hypothetical protein
LITGKSANNPAPGVGFAGKEALKGSGMMSRP